MVSKSAACNFFAAFAEGELRVEFREDGDEFVLDKSNIASTLERFSAEKRTRSGFLSGSRAFIAFETIKNGEEVPVDTDIGRILMRWRLLPRGGLSRIELCRNGMWITDDLPKLKNRFADFKPFHCVILLDASDGEIHRLVRKAEGPLHNHLEARKLFSKEEKAALNKAMEAIFSKINDVVPTLDTEEFEIEDFLAINSNGISSGGRRPGLAGQFQEVRRRPRFPMEKNNRENTEGGPGPADPESKGKGGGINENRRGRGTFRRSGNAIRFGALPISTGKRSCRVELAPSERKPSGSEVRFAIDESLDESCDAFGIRNIRKAEECQTRWNRPVQETMLTHDQEDHALGVKLGCARSRRSCSVSSSTMNYQQDIALPDDMPVVLKTHS